MTNYKDYNLSATEKKVLYLLTQGLVNDEIAEELKISVHTVKAHVSNIIHKLDAKNRTHAVCIAFHKRLVRILN